MEPSRKLPRLLPLLLLSSVLLPLASASTYYYYTDCPQACSPQQSCSPGLYPYCSCLDSCNGCLGYWYNCYTRFTPSFTGNGTVYDGFSCQCYWPWWSWLIFSIGLVLLIGGCIYAVMAANRRRRAQAEMQMQMQAQVAAQGGVPGYPPAPGYPAGYPAPMPAGAPCEPGYPPPPGQGYPAPGATHSTHPPQN